MSRVPEYPGMFQKERTLKGLGKAWLRTLPPEERGVFSTLGRMACSIRDINWHSLGGKARKASRCPRCKRFIGRGEHVCKRKGEGND